jgi:hypothetical protein
MSTPNLCLEVWRGIVYQNLYQNCSRDAGEWLAGRSGSVQVEHKHTSNVHACREHVVHVKFV